MEVPHAGDATGEEVMEVMYPRCAGLDVHKETVVACVRIVEGGDVSRSVRTFATTTASLIELGEWLEVNGCTHVAMEATGVTLWGRQGCRHPGRTADHVRAGDQPQDR